MRQLLTLLAVAVALVALPAFAAGRVRGAKPQALEAYAGAEFGCLDGSRTIAGHQINDDYCDCADGSDEPGTAACGATGIGFYCENSGWRALSLPSTRVDDGICDCCDGSDEQASRCPNTCAAKAAAHAVEEAERKAKVARARAGREEAVTRGKAAQQERRERLARLPAEIEQAKARAAELRERKDAEEALERQEAQARRQQAEREFAAAIGLHSLAHGDLQDVVLGLCLGNSVQAAREAVVALQPLAGAIVEGDVVVIAEKLETPEIADLRRELTAASEAYNASVAADPPAAPEEAAALLHKAEELKQNLAAAEQAFAEDKYTKMSEALHIAEVPVAELPAVAVRVAAAVYQSNRLLELVASVRRLENAAALNAPEAPENLSEHVREAARAARDELTQADRRVDELNSQLRETEEEDRIDFGPEQEFYTLKGQCFRRSHAGADYQLCPFKEAKQDHRNIGRWFDWHQQTEWHSKYRMQKYVEGDSYGCPKARSTTIQIECGESEEIIKVEEPEICGYYFVFTCRAACVDD